jgi:hypothetical protein
MGKYTAYVLRISPLSGSTFAPHDPASIDLSRLAYFVLDIYFAGIKQCLKNYVDSTSTIERFLNTSCTSSKASNVLSSFIEIVCITG